MSYLASHPTPFLFNPTQRTHTMDTNSTCRILCEQHYMANPTDTDCMGTDAECQHPSHQTTAQQVIDQHAQRILDEDHRCMAAIEAAWIAAYFEWENGTNYSPSASDLTAIACRIDSATFAPADEDEIYEMLYEGFTLGTIVESFYQTR